MSRSIDALLEEDLVDIARAGDRIFVYGVFCCIPSKKSGYTSGSFRTVIIVNSIQVAKEEVPQLSSQDVSKIRQISKLPDIFEILSNSIAPSISGQEYIKKAILCLLLGGVEKVLQNGTRLRGDINILLIGKILLLFLTVMKQFHSTSIEIGAVFVNPVFPCVVARSQIIAPLNNRHPKVVNITFSSSPGITIYIEIVHHFNH